VHASFLLGLGYIGLWILIKREWKALPTAIVSGLITLATAHGLGVIEFLTTFTENREALQFITEWRRPELFSALYLPFLGGLVFIVIGAYPQMIAPKHQKHIVPFTLLGMSSLRAVPPAWLALTPLVALSLQGLKIGTTPRLRLSLAMFFVVFVLVLPVFLVEGSEIPEDDFPVAAAPFLNTAPLFHDDRVGGYLIWSEGPDRLVYFDDRAELYGERMEEFVKVRNGDLAWEPIFERDGIGQVLLESDEELVTEISDAGWETVYSDDSYTVLRP
jgi:hypothetical protein